MAEPWSTCFNRKIETIVKDYYFLMTPSQAQAATASPWKDLRCLITNKNNLRFHSLKQILSWGAQQLQEKAGRNFQKILKSLKGTDWDSKATKKKKGPVSGTEEGIFHTRPSKATHSYCSLINICMRVKALP